MADKQQADKSKQPEKRVSIPRAIAIPALAGLGVGFGKGVMEGGLERVGEKVSKAIVPRLPGRMVRSRAFFERTFPWALARGGASSLSSILYFLSTLAAMKNLQ